MPKVSAAHQHAKKQYRSRMRRRWRKDRCPSGVPFTQCHVGWLRDALCTCGAHSRGQGLCTWLKERAGPGEGWGVTRRQVVRVSSPVAGLHCHGVLHQQVGRLRCCVLHDHEGLHHPRPTSVLRYDRPHCTRVAPRPPWDLHNCRNGTQSNHRACGVSVFDVPQRMLQLKCCGGCLEAWVKTRSSHGGATPRVLGRQLPPPPPPQCVTP